MTRPLLLLLLILTLLPMPIAAQADPLAKIDPGVLHTLRAKGHTEFWVVLSRQANLSAASRIRDWNVRGAYVVKQLQSTADRSQAELRQVLAKNKVRFKPFWIANAIYVEQADQQLLMNTAARADVVKIVAQELRPLPPIKRRVQSAAPAAGAIE